MVMWDEIAAEVAGEFPDMTSDKMLVDAKAEGDPDAQRRGHHERQASPAVIHRSISGTLSARPAIAFDGEPLSLLPGGIRAAGEKYRDSLHCSEDVVHGRSTRRLWR